MGGDLLQRINTEFARSNPELIKQIIKELPKPPATMLDLGCGDGTVVEIFANHGYDAHGIDLSAKLFPKNGKGKYACGNYLPRAVLLRTTPAEHIITEQTPDPYEILGKRPDQFDLFFIYPWRGQMPPVFDMFRNFAKKGASLIALGTEEDWEYNGDPGNLMNVTRPIFVKDEFAGRYTVYKKFS